MTILKYILLTIVSIIVLLLIIGLFINANFQVRSNISIDRPKEVVFDYLRHLKNQNHYNKWRQIDPNMKKDYRGEDGTVGFVFAWESEMKNAGVGEQEIISIAEGKRIDTELRFKEPFVSTDQMYMTTESRNEGGTEVTFAYNGKMKYPTNLLIPMIKNKIGNDMKDNLVALKSLLEEGNMAN